nr:hypothetical protein [Leptolyngbyaceae cyanobacterium MAG.088]
LRALKFDRLIDYSLFALLSMLSVCTKDQAYGLIVLPTVLLAYRCWRSNHKRKVLKLLIPAVIGLLTFVFIHNILFDFAAFEDHFNSLGKSGYTPTDFTHESTVYYQRYLYLVSRFFRDINFNLGWPLSIVSLTAIATALLRKNKQHLLLSLLVPCLSYYVFFLSFIMYSRDRFVIPICLIFCVFCGHYLGELLDTVKQAYKAKLVVWMTVISLLVYSFFYGNSVNALMMTDSRYFVETWMSNNIDINATVGFVEKKRNHPRFQGLAKQTITVREVSSETLKAVVDKQQFSYLITSSGYTANRFPKDHKQYKGFEKLSDGSVYKLIFCHRTTPLWSLLKIDEPSPVEYYDPRRKTGNLNKINPEICMYEKR